MIINLFTVRFVFKSLGECDYGIYNVIAGVIIMFQSVSAVLSTSTQRYFAYSLGDSGANNLRDIFSVSLKIFIILSILIIFLSETLGIWFINKQLHIPDNRLFTANVVFQYSLLSLIVGLIQSPYLSLIIAHEDMNIYACVSLVDCFLKFLAAFMISYFPYDRLHLYGAVMFFIPLFTCLCYIGICRRKYSECKWKTVKDKNLYHSLLSFSGWHLFSSIASIGMNQIITFLVNIFFGVLVNAARGISLQISGAVGAFSNNFIMAIRPPMIKAYAERNFDYLNKLFHYSNKFVFYFMLIIVLPMYFEMETILSIWLNSCNEQTVLFSRLILIYALIVSLNNPISIIMQASGKIKEYFVPVEVFTIFCPIITYLLFILGFPAETSYYAMIGTICCSHVVRLICLKKYYPPFNLHQYIFSFFLPAVLVLLLTFIEIYMMKLYVTDNFVVTIFLSIISILVFTVLVGLSKEERRLLLSLANRAIILKR